MMTRTATNVRSRSLTGFIHLNESEFLQTVKQRASERGLTQTRLAGEIGKTTAFISHVLHGRCGMSEHDVNKLRALLNRTPVTVRPRRKVGTNPRTEAYVANAAMALALKEARRNAGFTQMKLAESMKRHHSFVSQVESGRYSTTMVTLDRLALALGTDVQAILRRARELEVGPC